MIIEGKTLLATGFDDAIIGTTDDGRVVYSKVLMVEELVIESDMSVEDALEYLEFNTWCAHVGEFTPLYVNDFDYDKFQLNEFLNA